MVQLRTLQFYLTLTNNLVLQWLVEHKIYITIDKINSMPKHLSDQSDSDSDEENEKFVYKKPQVWRLDKFKNTKKIVINLSTTQYPVVTDVADDLGWKVQYDMEAGDWDIYWTDIPIDTDTLIKLHLFQKINYYPGIHTLARKNLLGMNLMNMKQRFPADYNFFPLTWMLPQQYVEFRQYFETKQQGKTRTYIVKPQAQCQGRGIFLTRSIEDLQNGKHYVVQRYIAKPYLMQGLKFDLRIYVLLCGTNPLRLYIYQDGLARFATQKYVQPTNQNLQHQFMHLTNYAINKKSPKFVFNNSSTNMGIGHKRSLKCIYDQMRKRGVNVDALKIKINDLIIKTIIAGLPLMSHQYKCCQPQDYSNSMCFHVIGFDVMLDHKEEPQLIQINHTPSFATDTPLDYKIKFNLIKDTFKLMHITSKRKGVLFNLAKQSNQARLHAKKRNILDGQQRQNRINDQQKLRDEYQNKHLGGYTRIYPLGQEESQKISYYENLIQGAYKMHYADNTPIRIKLEEAEKKKQVQEDMKNIKRLQENKKKKTNNDSIIGECRIKRTNTTNANLSQAIQSMTNFTVKKTTSARDQNAQQKNYRSQIQQAKQKKQNQQFLKNCSQIEKQPVSKDKNRQDENSPYMYKSQIFMEISDATPIEIVSTSETNIFSSQSTAITKNQDQKFQQSSIVRKDSYARLNSTDKLTDKHISTLPTLPGYPKIFTSIERQLMRKQSGQICSSNKFANFSEKIISKDYQKSMFASQTPEGPRYIFSDLFPKQKKLASNQKRRKYSRQGQLPNIYDNNSDALDLETKKIQIYKVKSVSKNGKLLNSIAQNMKSLRQTKNKRNKHQSEQKIIDMSQMTRLVSRKINYSHFKGNINNHVHLCNNIPVAIGPGGFVIPKMYQLNVESQKCIQATQNIIAMISRKNVSKNIFPC